MSATRFRPLLSAAACGVLALVATAYAPIPAAAKGSLSRVESEFEKAIKRVTPATVVCLPWGVDQKLIVGGSSGVVMSRKGLILSDGDVGIHLDKPRARGVTSKPIWSDDIEIRMPHLKGKGFRSFRARVIRRDKDNDTTLIRMEKPPIGLKYLQAGNSDELDVGDFAFAMGNSFGLAAEAPPTLTAGVVAGLVPRKESSGGRWQSIYTSAAVNPGVNGGPLVDIHGQLIGTISSAVSLVQRNVAPDNPQLAYAYLGKVVPVERLRALYASLPEAEELFPDKKGTPPRAGESAALATVFHHTAQRAYAAVVSLEIKRKGRLNTTEFARGRPVQIPRYLGPVSGVLISADGYILTSLYNLGNIAGLVDPRVGARLPDNAKLVAGIKAIESVTVHLPDGRAVPSKLVARHEAIGIALLKADMGTGTSAGGSAKGYHLLQPAQADDFKPGRFVLAVGNPFGKDRLESPLLTVGILSKQHAPTVNATWASQWQTDAGITDANSGGAAVDVHGRLLGILTIWSSTMHGRNSGIGFIVPWPQIEACLGELKRGRTFQRPFLGITWKRLSGGLPTTILGTVVKGQAAEKAGLKPGDEILAINGQTVRTPDDVRSIFVGKWAGDTVKLKIRRAGGDQEIEVTLGAR